MTNNRLEKQIHFILEIDKLKSIIRRTYLVNTERFENSAEHSWHLAMMAILLAEYANEPVDLLTVLKMLLIHDIIEIDAGDTFAYDPVGNQDQAEREEQAADRLFNLLPEEQAVELRALWDAFEARVTPEARFAKALDRLMPILHNYASYGKAWQENGIRREQVIAYNQHMAEGSATLWEYARATIDDAVAQGYLAR
jgi:putative hydrolase of HD superfamily